MYLRTVDPAAQAGTKVEVLGPYALLSPLASGSLTTLHRARRSAAQDGDAGHCVVKRLQRRYVNDGELRTLLLATGRAALAVKSPDIVRTLEVHEQPEPFVVMEYLSGADLHSLLRAAGGNDVARHALPIVLDVLDGLQALHELRTEAGAPAGLVHGAPCARHIMVGNDGLGRLVDFTHAVGPILPWAPRRDERLVPSEMAPEQALAPAHVDPRCDQFIVGTLLWEVLTGKSLFASDDADASLRNLLRSPIPAPSEAGSSAGRSLDRICLRALQRARGDRFESAGEMGATLREEAARAGLLASREDVGAWVRGLSHAQPRVREPQVTKRPTIMGWQSEQPSAAAPTFRPARSTPTLSFTQRDFAAAMSAAQSTQSVGAAGTQAREEQARPPASQTRPLAVDVVESSPTGARFVPSRPPEEREPAALGTVVPFASSRPGAPISSAPPPSGDPLDGAGFPSMWQKPQVSVPPARATRGMPANKPAMFTGIAIALVVPALVLVLIGDGKSPTERHETRPRAARRELGVSDPAPVAAQAAGSTVEAFARQETGQALAPAPSEPSLPAPEADGDERSPSAARTPAAAEPPLDRTTRLAPRVDPRPPAYTPASTSGVSEPGGRRGKRAQVEGLPTNPY